MIKRQKLLISMIFQVTQRYHQKFAATQQREQLFDKGSEIAAFVDSEIIDKVKNIDFKDY